MGRSCKAALLGLALWGSVGLSPCVLAADEPSLPEVALQRGDRILILAPHPDDEVIGCAGIIQQAVKMKLPLRVVFLTHGDNNELSFMLYRRHPVLMPKAVRQMGEIRRTEALAAAKILGVASEQLVFLGYPDWGTLPIWYQHWGEQPLYRSMLTRVTAVPYSDAFRPGASYKGEEILADLETLLREFHPTKVFVSHPTDAHPDHRACYLFARIALWDVESKAPCEMYPYLVHYKQWPARAPHPSKTILKPPPSLAQVIWKTHALTPEETKKKGEALQAHKSQYRVSPKSFPTFVRPNELFGDFPAIRLSPQIPSVNLAQNGLGLPQEAPEELTDQERAAFVGLEWRYAQWEGEDLVLSITFSRPLAKEVAASLYLFGYRDDHPFAQMPKLHLQMGVFRHDVYNQTQRLPSQWIRIDRQAKEVTVRVPFELLGNPQRILVSAQTYLAEVPLDQISWRTLEVGEPPKEETSMKSRLLFGLVDTDRQDDHRQACKSDSS